MSKKRTSSKKDKNFEKLITDIRNSLETHLKEMLSKMFNDADEKLFELADSANSNEDQNRYFELMRNLREFKPDISTDFLINTKNLLKPFAQAEARKKKKTSDSEDELSLMGQDEMEDMVMVKRVGGDAAARFREAISHLEARLEHLALKTPKIFSKNALDPINICQAFDEALGEYFDITNKKLVFDMFDINVACKLDTVYDATNNLLIDAGILPQIKLHASKSKSKKRPTPPPEEHMEDGGEGEMDQPINQGGYAMTATPGHGHRGGGSSAGSRAGMGFPGRTGQQAGEGQAGAAGSHGGAESGSEGQAGAAGSYGGPGGGGAGGEGQPGAGSHSGPGGGGAGGEGQAGAAGSYGGSEGDGAGGEGQAGSSGGSSNANTDAESSGEQADGSYQHNTAGMPASHVSQTLGEYLGAPIAPGAGSKEDHGEGSEAYPAANKQFYGHSDILTALSGLQINPEFSSSGELKFDGEAIKQAVLAEISKTSGGVVTKRINRIAEKTIDFIELIFDAIIEDEDISDTIKALLLRLQIPVIKASMVDQEFFIYDDHPARVLLDRIAEVGIGVTEHSDEVYIELDRIISKLVTEFELQTSSFQQALDSLNAFDDEREELARKQEEETQLQVLRGHARNTVLKSLRSITRGKTLPESTHALVLKRWPTIMYNHYLNHGKENDEWVTIVVTLRDIIESIQPLKTVQDLNKLKGSKDRLVETALEYLNLTNQSKKDIEAVIHGLEDVYQNHIDNADFSEEEIEEAQEVEVENTTEDEQETQAEEVTEPELIEDEEPPVPPLPADVMPGMWFQLYMGEDKILRRGKLSVIIAQDANLVFVNYQGGIIIEKSFEEFSDELDQGLSKTIMGHSVFDHALSRVVTGLNK